MKTKIGISIVLVFLIITGAFAQPPQFKVKITDTKGVTTIVERVSSSSSSSCNTSDFPVYQGTEKRDVDFSDLKSIIVRHDQPAEDANNYITIELVDKKGKSGIYEMIKNIRITGKSESGDFSVKINDVETIEVLD